MVLLLGVGLVVVGTLIAIVPGLIPADTTSLGDGFSTSSGGGLAIRPLGVALLAGGIGIGAAVLGYLFGSRRRTT
ncbi:hypothetical protein DXT87_11520 [Arthrobacter sp. AET 35A]|nr:hypothetical protein [Arthrobacter sp. AET 35A]